jgi:hypothetical protein
MMNAILGPEAPSKIADVPLSTTIKSPIQVTKNQLWGKN